MSDQRILDHKHKLDQPSKDGAKHPASFQMPTAALGTKNVLRAALGKEVNIESVVTGALDGVAAFGLETAAAKLATRYVPQYGRRR